MTIKLPDYEGAPTLLLLISTFSGEMGYSPLLQTRVSYAHDLFTVWYVIKIDFYTVTGIVPVQFHLLIPVFNNLIDITPLENLTNCLLYCTCTLIVTITDRFNLSF